MRQHHYLEKVSLSKLENKEFICVSELMDLLGYKEKSSFEKVIDKVKLSMASSNIDACKHIIPASQTSEMKLSKFACYLAAMNADTEKQEVAKAQAYLALQSSRFEKHLACRPPDTSRADYAKSIFQAVMEEEKMKTKGINK